LSDQGVLDVSDPEAEMVRISLRVLVNQVKFKVGVVWTLQIAYRADNEDPHERSGPTWVNHV
jgi:hypothetical protein